MIAFLKLCDASCVDLLYGTCPSYQLNRVTFFADEMDLKETLNKTISFLSGMISLSKAPLIKGKGFLSNISCLTLHLEDTTEMHLIMKAPLGPKEEKQHLF